METTRAQELVYALYGTYQVCNDVVVCLAGFVFQRFPFAVFRKPMWIKFPKCQKIGEKESSRPFSGIRERISLVFSGIPFLNLRVDAITLEGSHSRI